MIINIGIIYHETVWTSYFLKNINRTDFFIYFVPVRENVKTDCISPNIDNIENVKVLRGENKYQALLEKKPEIIIDTRFDWSSILLESSYKPKMILLTSKTSIKNYEKLSNQEKGKLQSITFINFWISILKQPDSKGVATSGYKTLKRKCLHNKNVYLILGYGETGNPFAELLRNKKKTVKIYEIDPIKKVIAHKNNFIVGELSSICNNVDVVIDTTGSRCVIKESDLKYFKKPMVNFISFSTNGEAFCFKEQKNRFIIDYSRGMANMTERVGGNSYASMQVTGVANLWFLGNYNSSDFVKNLENIEHSLYKYSKKQEEQIASNVPLFSQQSLRK